MGVLTTLGSVHTRLTHTLKKHVQVAINGKKLLSGWLVPSLFSGPYIGFMQALGIMALLSVVGGTFRSKK